MLTKIVVLDGYTLNPGDLSWEALERLASTVEIHDRTAPDQIVSRAAGADVLLTNKVRLTADTLALLPDLRFIGVLATGYDVVDVAAAAGRGIPVANVPAYSTHSVVQMVFGFILHWASGIAHHSERVKDGAWSRCPDFSFWDFPLRELAGKTLGILGFGRIGQQVGRVGHAFGMRIAAHVRTPKDVDFPVDYLALESVFREADFLCLLCPLTPETRGLVNAERLAWMKPGAYLINTARGPIVVEEDLANALQAGNLAGAGLDVLSTEPPPPDNPLLTAPNAVVTPHYAWATHESRTRLLDVAVANIRAFAAGSPQNIVNGVGRPTQP